MSKRKHRKPIGRKSSGSRKQAPPAPHHPPPPPSEPDTLLSGLDEVLAEEHPLSMLAHASALLEAARPERPAPPFDRSDQDQGQPSLPPVGELLEVFVESGQPQTAVLAWVMAHLSEDELVRVKVTRAVDRRILPRWARELSDVDVYAAHQTADTLRDGSNLTFGVRVAGYELTLVAFIDFNAGGALKDAFAIPESLEMVASAWRRFDVESATELRSLSPADARAWVEPAAEYGAMIWPPFESDSWPAARPLLEWVLRHCPDGGNGFDRPDYDDDARERMIDEFLASGAGRPFDDPEHRDLLQTLIWFGCDYGYGDPLLLSPTKIEILLLDWVPRKIVAEADLLAKLPALLLAFVPYGHRARGVGPVDTEETLGQVRELTPEYLGLIRAPRRQGAEAVLDWMGAFDGLSDDDYRYQILGGQVGGRAELDALDAAPLPEEELELSGVPADIADRVRQVGELGDRCCEELFDIEIRTAVRRLLHDVAVGDPQIFRRRSRNDTAAAALCWLVGRANTVMDWGGVQSQELMAHFELTGSPSQRAEAMRVAIGLPRFATGHALGSSRYLTAASRERILAQRDAGRAD